MPSEWKISSQYIGDEKYYIAYRLKNKNAVDHTGNREFRGHYSKDISEVEKMVEELNKEV